MASNSIDRYLEIYLRNHEAAARAGVNLFRRAVSGQRGQPYAGALRELLGEVRQDRNTLGQLLQTVGVRPDRLLAAALQAGEVIGRGKPNGALVRRSPLSDLVELEALLTAVQAKRSGWLALKAAGLQEISGTPDLVRLCHRAERQADQLTEFHQLVAARVLTTGQ